jgi:hypothetical protein
MKLKSLAFQVDLARQAERPSTLKEIIDFGGSMGYNELFLYGEGSLEYKTHPNCSNPWALTQKNFTKLQEYAKAKYSMLLIPIIPVLGHADFILNIKELEHLREVKDPTDNIINVNMRQFCTTNPETYKVIEELISEWAEITSSPYIHIGGDESWNFAACSDCRKKAEKIGRGRMLAEYLNDINDIVKKQGKKTMVWQDMLFYFEDCLQYLDKDIIICDWHYETVERHPGISIYNWKKTNFQAAYKKHGLSFLVCPKSKCNYEEETLNIKSLLEYSEKNNPAGVLNTAWVMSGIPYASCYPSLAYCAACNNGNTLPDTREFLHKFAKENFEGDIDLLPLLIDLFGNVAELEPFTGLGKWITYQNSEPDMIVAGKLDEGVNFLKKIKGKTVAGKAYKEALKLIFRRMAIAKRLEANVNEIAKDYASDNIVKSGILNKLATISLLVEKIPKQIKLEQRVWNKNRYKDQTNPIVKQWEEAESTIGEFIKSVRKIIDGKAKASTLFQPTLELTLVNNDCSWQELTIFSSDTGKNYQKIGIYPQCGPFGRHVKTFKLPNAGKFIKLELAGLGQLLLHYARIIGPNLELSPKEIISDEGAVIDKEHILIDDYKPTQMGSVNACKYFSNGTEQPKAIIEIKMTNVKHSHL